MLVRHRLRPPRRIAYFVRGQKNPRSPSLRRRGTTWTCRCGTDCETTLLTALKMPSASIASRTATLRRWVASARPPSRSCWRVEERLDVLARDEQRVAGEQRPVVEEGEERSSS